MKTRLITCFKDVTPDGGVIEPVVLRLPAPGRPGELGFKCRAAYAMGGVRLLGFDDERGKGDHCHIRGTGRKCTFTFTSVEQSIGDFIAAVDTARDRT